MNSSLLSKMIQQFRERHGKPPGKIVIQPSALVALAVKQSLGPCWEGIPVESRDLSQDEVAVLHDQGENMGVFLKPSGFKAHIAACDLK